jgi:hypothetical protein
MFWGTELIANTGIIPHILGNGFFPELILLEELVLLTTSLLRRHGEQNRKVFDRCLQKVALEAVSKVCESARVRANMASMKQRFTTTFNDDSHVVAHLQQSLFLVRDIHALHQALDGGDKGVIAGPKVPVRDCWLTSPVTNLSLELIEDVAWSADECGDDFETRRADGEDRGEEAEEEEEVVESRTHHGGRV